MFSISIAWRFYYWASNKKWWFGNSIHKNLSKWVCRHWTRATIVKVGIKRL